MKIMFIVNSLDVGGTERMVLKLATNKIFIDDQIIIVTLTSGRKLVSEFSKINFKIFSLGLSHNPFTWFKTFKLIFLTLKIKPDVIHSWLYQSDIVSILTKIFYKKCSIIWSLRQSNLSKKHNKLSTRFCMKVCAFLSNSIPNAIISNAIKAKEAHISIGYAEKKIKIIPNGFSSSEFFYDKRGASKIRSEIGIDFNIPLVGIVGRYNSQKNYSGFFEIAKIIQLSIPNIHFCLVGKDITLDNPRLKSMIQTNAINSNQIHCLGERKDIKNIMSALDILALPSEGEAFPNVIGEAMLCETPCVVNNVGDCAQIIGPTGKKVKVGEIYDFAKKIMEILSLSKLKKNKIGKSARYQIKKFYDIDKIAKRYRDFYLNFNSQIKEKR